MKTLVSTGAIALLLTLTACGPSTPPTKKVDKNTNQPAAGSIKSPTEALKEKMGAADGAAAASAGGTAKKP